MLPHSPLKISEYVDLSSDKFKLQPLLFLWGLPNYQILDTYLDKTFIVILSGMTLLVPNPTYPEHSES